ncbi:hypothetical protein PMT97_06135 [Enterococcus faecalis]|uniref:hypothetical protein n=1 Tax=Enterococcus faecalis TaxID=1351 RepID=UPI000DFA26A7|nr:hypothetical protein [Enterococcus faecalis]EGO8274650.1 hypothetical protein [Enterococcus faecalis]MDB1623677.1 hypothetical protein [Enterococcus faecalis]NSW11505.1 hypothetical protein [Enterococcus faecalis]RBR46034.1 hypothetical protein EB28_01555 [Enterococcus faecalis]
MKLMKKKIAVLLATCLLVQPFLSVSAWAIEGEQQTERTQTQPKTAESSTSEATKESSTHSIEQPSMTASSAITEKVTTSSTETKPSEEQKQITLTFETTDQALFLNDAKSYQVVKEKNQPLRAEELPKWANREENSTFVGWSYQGKTYTNEELLQLEFSEDTQLTAVFKQKLTRMARAVSVDQSIADTIATADKTKVIVVPSPVGDGAAYREYASTEAGLKEALFDLYQQGNNDDFTLYIGTNITTSAATTAKVIPDTVTASNMTFYALQGKVNHLVITGNSADPISMDQTAPTGSKTLGFNQNIFFGSNITLRNLSYTGTNMYLNGYSLNLNGGSSGNGLTVYGGTDTGDVSGNPTLTVNSTGTGTWNFYGGNQNGGNLAGNPTIVINNTRSGLNTLSGGANIGTVTGNTSLVVNDSGGRIASIYGGGYGTNATNTANVTGNVSTKVAITNAATGFQLSTYYGGVQYGNIGGKVTNDISGYGRWYTAGQRFIGGSSRGDIGTNRATDGITTNLNTQLYSAGRADFEGGNQYSGTIIGDITNVVTAGTNTAGGINDFNGGAGNNVSKFNKSQIGASNEATYDAYTPQQRAELAKSAAAFKVFGNISSKLVSGSFNNGAIYSTAAGRGGYIEGNTTIEVGTANSDGSLGGDGMAYSGAKPTSLDYSTTNKSRGYSSGWDIVGGGGYPASNDTWDIYIKGDTKTVLNNTIARWTYGGSFSGVVEGNTSNTLNGGIADTLEGTGYQAARVYGNGQTIVNNGQVDWFLSGGGWNDAKNVGNVGVTVYEGVINASMGASYGASGGHTITGNSDNRIYGGDFSGTPRTGANGFSGGITNAGSLLGNASLLIDLRNYNGEFKLPGNTYITGGRPYGQNTTLGTDESNTITLNIFTKTGVESLNGASIYGDGGTNAAYTKNGKITMNIQATGSSIGNLYATQYSNISGGKILRDVTANVQGAVSINGLSGGSSTDNFTNAIVNASSNKVVFNFGANVDGTNNYQTEPLNATGLGVVNFTELNVTNGIKLMANGGNIKNGVSATAANHSTTYNEFGSIHLSKNAGIGITNTANLISASKLTVQDHATLETIPGTGKVNIADFEAVDPTKDELLWIKPTTDTTALVDSTGTWFGNVKAYQVLTINPTVNNATKLTPTTFRGIEKATGKTFIGDNDVTKGANGYGIAIPGSIIDYEVETPGIVAGAGTISHDVKEVKAGNAPLTLQAWGTEVAGQKVQKGRLMIPTSSTLTPTLSFLPDEVTGSWLHQGTVKSSEVGSAIEQIPEQKDTTPLSWKATNTNYSYQVKVQFSNKVELSGQSVIVTEDEAAQLTTVDKVMEMLGAKGRPFFKTSLKETDLPQIQAPLAEKNLSRTHDIQLEAGTSGENLQNKTVHLVVVKNESVLAKDRSFALYATSAHLKLKEANGLTNSDELAQWTQATVIFADGRANQTPSLDAATFQAIQQAKPEELAKTVPANYQFTEAGETLSKKVNVSISGELTLEKVPKTIDFGKQKISAKPEVYWPTLSDDLVVQDTRGTESTPWKLNVQVTNPLTNGTDQLEDLSLVTDKGEFLLNKGDTVVTENEGSGSGSYTINQGWGAANQRGLKLSVPVEKQKVGEFKGTLSWSLVMAP